MRRRKSLPQVKSGCQVRSETWGNSRFHKNRNTVTICGMPETRNQTTWFCKDNFWLNNECLDSSIPQNKEWLICGRILWLWLRFRRAQSHQVPHCPSRVTTFYKTFVSSSCDTRRRKSVLASIKKKKEACRMQWFIVHIWCYITF